MIDNKPKITMTCPHCQFESKAKTFSNGANIICANCKDNFIFDDTIRIKYFFYCPHCNLYGSSRSVSLNKKAKCSKCKGKIMISKNAIKPLIILDKWYEWAFFIFPKTIFLIYPTMLLIAPILLLITIFYMFLPGYRGLSDELFYQRTVWKFWFGFWFLFSFFGPNSIKRLKILAGTYNKKTLYYLCFILINLLSFYLMMLIMGYFMKMNVH
tara:strand:- start:9575 stop:10210 length:636 start_codon:yes stop_codon:yes gene_type:complete